MFLFSSEIEAENKKNSFEKCEIIIAENDGIVVMRTHAIKIITIGA